MLSFVNGTLVIILLTQLNTTRCGKLLYSEMNTYYNHNNVKKSSTWGQSAWVIINSPLYSIKYIVITYINSIEYYITTPIYIMKNNSSETTRSAFNRGNTKYGSTRENFQWGVTDGDGTFYFGRTLKGIWTFTFKVGQSNYNLRLLYHIKNIVGVGSVSVTNDKSNIAEFRVRNIPHIIEFILPIFDSFPLLTSKHFHYTKFKEAILIINDSSLCRKTKDRLITAIKNDSPPTDYVSRSTITNANNMITGEITLIISKSWIIGKQRVVFTLFKKDHND